MKVVAVLFLLAAAAVQVYTRPDGAPLGACATITPVGHINPPNSVPPPPNPYSLYLNDFACPSGTTGYCYYPGATYQCKCGQVSLVCVDIIVVKASGLLKRRDLSCKVYNLLHETASGIVL